LHQRQSGSRSLPFPLPIYPETEAYHEAIKLAEKLREQEREAEELKRLVKELEALERQLRVLQEQCEQAKRELKEREDREVVGDPGDALEA
jgi:geranylgeranyl pyrophosphate synthase